MDTKYRDVSDETQKTFNEVLDATSIPHWIEFVLLADDRQKKVVVARKQNELTFHLSGKDIAIIINEAIFDEMEIEYQKKIIEESLGGIVITDSDKVKIETPDFSTYSGYLEKYGADDVILMKMSVETYYEKKKQEDIDEKERLKEENKNV